MSRGARLHSEMTAEQIRAIEEHAYAALDRLLEEVRQEFRRRLRQKEAADAP